MRDIMAQILDIPDNLGWVATNRGAEGTEYRGLKGCGVGFLEGGSQSPPTLARVSGGAL